MIKKESNRYVLGLQGILVIKIDIAVEIYPQKYQVSKSSSVNRVVHVTTAAKKRLTVRREFDGEKRKEDNFAAEAKFLKTQTYHLSLHILSSAIHSR